MGGKTISREVSRKMTQLQKNIIIGLILGDGYIYLDKYKRAILEIKQSDSKKEYVFWLYQKLKDICASLPRKRKDNNQWRLLTKTDPVLLHYKRLFYREGKKIVPVNIEDLLQVPISVAIWYLDDGSLDFREKDHYAYTLHTNCFSLEETRLLQAVFEENFGITPTIQTPLCRGIRYPRLYFGSKSRDRFYQIISPYRFKCFVNKFPRNPSETIR